MTTSKLFILSFAAVYALGCGTNDSSIDMKVGDEEVGQGGAAAQNDTVPMENNEGIHSNNGMSAADGVVSGDEENANGLSDALVETAFEYLLGTFDSSAQATANPSYFNVQLKACRVDAPELGDRVLYIEQAMGSDPTSPYRQRLYRVYDNGDGRVASEVYTVANESQYVGLCDGAGDRTFTLDQLSVREGCTVFLEPNTDGFEGGTEGSNCASSLRGASYATSVVTLKNDRILSWDQGFDASGLQVWGSVAGPYEFIRIGAVPSPMNPDDLGNGDINTDDSDNDIDEIGRTGNYGGETCVDAPALVEASDSLNGTGSTFRYRVVSDFGSEDNYNPLQSSPSGAAPGCSLVYDAIGRDTVFSIVLQPGETLALRVETQPANIVAGIYFLDGCETPSWPDIDGSGACGNNEYAATTTCQGNQPCEPLQWEFQWPVIMNGAETDNKQLFLVVDQIAGQNAESFTLDWRIY